MSLNVKKINRLRPRIILSFLITLSISILTVSITVYLLLSNALRESDHQKIIQEGQFLYSNYKEFGYKKIVRNLGEDKLLIIKNSQGKILFKKIPTYFDGDYEDEEESEQLSKAVNEEHLAIGWYTVLFMSGEEELDLYHRWEHWFRLVAWKYQWENILPLIDNDMFEIYTFIEDGLTISYGTSSEGREEYLSAIRKVSLIVFLPFILIGLIISSFLARGILLPVQRLIDTIKRIKESQSVEFVPRSFNGDEIDVLAQEFNSLVEQNDKLVSNLKNTLDAVAHDLRTPITRFRMKAEKILLAEEVDPQNLRETLASGLEETEEILVLLTSILDIAEADHQVLKLNIEKIDLIQIVDRLYSLYEFVAEDKNINIKINSSRSPLWIRADVTRLTQAFANLLDNAIKYSLPGSVVEINVFEADGEVTFEISDQGVGIPEEEASLIWNRFFRGRVASSSANGLGIGLSLTHAILSAHGYKIELESPRSKGTKFIIKLPICNV